MFGLVDITLQCNRDGLSFDGGRFLKKVYITWLKEEKVRRINEHMISHFHTNIKNYKQIIHIIILVCFKQEQFLVIGVSKES